MKYLLSANFIVILIFDVVSSNKYIEADGIGKKVELNIIKKLEQSVKDYMKLMNVSQDNYLQSSFERYNEDVYLNISQLIRKYGLPFEKHHVVTEDGYKLSLFRIPTAGPPVLLMHGLLMSADDWVTAGPESGIAYLLAAEGYDVWMGNARGNKHSRQHLSLSSDSAKFWDFSWDEIGRYDLPAMIDYILLITGKQQLKFVGFSQGTTVFFVMCSERPEYNDKVSLMVAMGAATAIPNLRCPFFQFLNNVTQSHIEVIFMLMRQIGYDKMSPSDLLMKTLSSVLCGEGTSLVCSDMVFLLCGFGYSQINVKNMPVIFSHTPAGAATKQVQHFAQGFTTGLFQRFDYGKKENMKLYGSKIPPFYPIERITTAVVLFCSMDDQLATITDCRILRKRLRNVVDFYVVPSEDFGHLDFLFSKNVKRLVFSRLLYLLKTH